jgi:DNA primase
MAKQWISRDAVLAHLDMVAVLDHYQLIKGNAHVGNTSFRIHCPFHEDDRPSCSINTESKVFNCFACGEQGNVFDLIAGVEGLDPKSQFRKVLETAVTILGHNPTPKRGTRKQEVKKEDQSKPASDTDPGKSAKSKRPKKKIKAKKRSKVKSRVDDKSLDLEPNRVLESPAFPLKLSLDNPWLKQRLDQLGVSQEFASQFGIGYETRSNALMAGRVCFPVHNRNGELVAYSGRWAGDPNEDGLFIDDKGQGQPKYKLPKGFQKQLELFNFHRVADQFEEIQTHTRTLVLVEGFWSCLRLSFLNPFSSNGTSSDDDPSGIPCIALMGKTLSRAQIKLLEDLKIDQIMLMLDGDEAGKSASETLVQDLSSRFYVRNADLEEGQMPDELSNEALLGILHRSGLGLSASNKGAIDLEEIDKPEKEVPNFPLNGSDRFEPYSITARASWS